MATLLRPIVKRDAAQLSHKSSKSFIFGVLHECVNAYMAIVALDLGPGCRLWLMMESFLVDLFVCFFVMGDNAIIGSSIVKATQ